MYWEEQTLADRETFFEYLFDFNPAAAEKADDWIEKRVEHLLDHPLMGVERPGIPGRLLIIPEVSMIVSYQVDATTIRVMRVLHEKREFPN